MKTTAWVIALACMVGGVCWVLKIIHDMLPCCGHLFG